MRRKKGWEERKKKERGKGNGGGGGGVIRRGVEFDVASEAADMAFSRNVPFPPFPFLFYFIFTFTASFFSIQ